MRGKKGIPHDDPDDPPRRRANNRRGHGTFTTDRPPIAGVVGRESGEVRLDVLGSAGGEELEEVIDDTCLGETTVNTDEWDGYNRVGGRHGRVHRTVDHTGPKCTWVIDADGDGVREVHCNTMEGLWTGLAAATPPELAYQVGALLAVLGVHRGTRRLLVLADGARWIREWFEGLGVPGGTMIVCWWHLVKRVQQDLSRAGRGREHRHAVASAVLKALWHGRVDEALGVLRSRSGEMKNTEALEELIGYLEARRPYLPDDEARQRAGLWIASNRVEKFNDGSVSARCRHQGMEWTEAGVVSLAVLEAARRNGELPTWRAQHSLPAWKVPKRRKKVA